MSTTVSLPFVRKWLNRYVCVFGAYGFGRSVTYDYEGTKRYYNSRTQAFERKDRLWVDCIGRTVVHTFGALTCWPVMVGDDLVRFECFARGRNLIEYGGGTSEEVARQHGL